MSEDRSKEKCSECCGAGRDVPADTGSIVKALQLIEDLSMVIPDGESDAAWRLGRISAIAAEAIRQAK